MVNSAAPTSIVGASAGTLARAIRDGTLGSLEAVDAHIARIEAQEDRLNAMAVPMFEEARAAARAADRARAEGSALGPLHGVPITLKAQFMVAGTEVNLGVPHHEGRIDAADGPLVARLRKAGAVILGKTNIMQMLLGHETDNPVYGRTNNPWNLDRTPGGSSGGEAAVIASGGSPLGLGGDLGGSIRLPAHFCGIHGLKPTARRLPLDDTPMEGFFPLGQEAIIAQVGPMARQVADLALAMSVMAGPYDERLLDLVRPVPWPSAEAVDVKDLTVGTFEEDGRFAPSPAVRRVVREAAGHLEARGARVVAFAPPDADAALDLFLDLLTADGGRTTKRVLAPDKPNHLLKPIMQGGAAPRALRPLVSGLLGLLGQSAATRIVRHGGPRSTQQYWDLVAANNAYRVGLLNAMADAGIDALLCPPYGVAAPLHGATTDLLSAAGYAVLFNVTGLPAGVVAASRIRDGEESDRASSRDRTVRVAGKCERGSAGLPVGVQVAAPLWREDVVLAVMAALEEGFGDTADYPGLAPQAPA
jgi:fatty acid amide hydrolase